MLDHPPPFPSEADKSLWFPNPELIGELISKDGYLGYWKHLKFIVSISVEEDGRWWLHASVSRTDMKLPTYADLKHLKHFTIGDDRTAYQVFPPADHHINLAEVLHLWHRLEGPLPLPDFTRGGSTI